MHQRSQKSCTRLAGQNNTLRRLTRVFNWIVLSVTALGCHSIVPVDCLL